jgi:hypothetical protein
MNSQHQRPDATKLARVAWSSVFASVIALPLMGASRCDGLDAETKRTLTSLADRTLTTAQESLERRRAQLQAEAAKDSPTPPPEEQAPTPEEFPSPPKEPKPAAADAASATTGAEQVEDVSQ